MNKKTPLAPLFKDQCFSFAEGKNGYEYPRVSQDIESEYDCVRNQIGLTDLSYVDVYKISGVDAIDFLDFIVCGDVGGLRDEEILLSCVVGQNGNIVADVCVANDNDEFFLFVDDADYVQLKAIIIENKEGFEVEIENLNHKFALFSVDGPYAWIPLKNIFSTEILGIEYLNFLYTEDEHQTYIFRAGKTGEYGYWVMTYKENAMDACNLILNSAGDHHISLYGRDVSQVFRLENNFHNYSAATYAENPYELGLFWQIYIEKDMHTKVLKENLQNGIKRWSVGFVVDSTTEFSVGDTVHCNGIEIGQVIDKAYSYQLKTFIGSALLKKEYAYSNLEYSINDDRLNTVSTPFITNKSLFLKPE